MQNINYIYSIKQQPLQLKNKKILTNKNLSVDICI